MVLLLADPLAEADAAHDDVRAEAAVHAFSLMLGVQQPISGQPAPELNPDAHRPRCPGHRRPPKRQPGLGMCTGHVHVAVREVSDEAARP